MRGKKNPCSLLWKCKLVQPLWKIWSFPPQKLKIELPYDPVIPLLDVYVKKIKTLTWKVVWISHLSCERFRKIWVPTWRPKHNFLLPCFLFFFFFSFKFYWKFRNVLQTSVKHYIHFTGHTYQANCSWQSLAEPTPKVHVHCSTIYNIQDMETT